VKHISFDFNNLFSSAVGRSRGVTDSELARLTPSLKKAHAHLAALIKNRGNRVSLGIEWTQLPFQRKGDILRIQRMGNAIARKYDAVVSLGIGGSYLGLKAAQDALCPPYYNEFVRLRNGRPRIYFEGNNMDPDTLATLLDNLNPVRTCVVVISKSGETTETKVAFEVTEAWLRRRLGQRAGRHIYAITDPVKGSLRQRITTEQAKDPLSFQNLPLLAGVGGRFSELNMGLLHLAIIGVPIQEVLNGARAMSHRCATATIARNPALLYAALHTILYRRKHAPIAVMMPFAETLKSTADWYVQLLAESLGKKYGRRCTVLPSGIEQWNRDDRRVLNAGRTPVAARGTNDLHSIQQNCIEGEPDKVATVIRLGRVRRELVVPVTGTVLSGKRFSALMTLAQEATEWALAREHRPSCSITLPALTPFHWGALLFFFEMAIAYEGELLNVNAFDQPGVEGYKQYMFVRLGKPGVPAAIARDIARHPLRRSSRHILQG